MSLRDAIATAIYEGYLAWCESDEDRIVLVSTPIVEAAVRDWFTTHTEEMAVALGESSERDSTYRSNVRAMLAVAFPEEA